MLPNVQQKTKDRELLLKILIEHGGTTTRKILKVGSSLGYGRIETVLQDLAKDKLIEKRMRHMKNGEYISIYKETTQIKSFKENYWHNSRELNILKLYENVMQKIDLSRPELAGMHGGEK